MNVAQSNVRHTTSVCRAPGRYICMLRLPTSSRTNFFFNAVCQNIGTGLNTFMGEGDVIVL